MTSTAFPPIHQTIRLIPILVLTALCTACHTTAHRPAEDTAKEKSDDLDLVTEWHNGKISDMVPLGFSLFEGGPYYFQASKAAVKATPKWSPDTSDFPPLSPRKALEAARQEAHRIAPYVQGWWEYIELRPLVTNKRWFYVVCFDRADIVITGSPPEPLHIPVLMDGQAIRADKEQRWFSN
jgi:hypothetical protein